MNKQSTKFGTWIRIFCAKHGINVAKMSEQLCIAPATMSLIISGRHPIPTFLRENIIITFGLDADEIREMDLSIVATETETVVSTRNYRNYACVQALYDKPWTPSMMSEIAQKVNALSAEDADKIIQILKNTSVNQDCINAGIPECINMDTIITNVHARYKNQEKAKQIIDYIKSSRN